MVSVRVEAQSGNLKKSHNYEMVKLVDWKEENKDREGQQVKWRGGEVENEETEKRRKSG